MIDDYTTSGVTLKRAGAISGAGEYTYTTVSILARQQIKRRMVRTAQGAEVISETQIFTSTAVTDKDRIAIGSYEYPVRLVESIKDLDGDVLWYEVYL